MPRHEIIWPPDTSIHLRYPGGEIPQRCGDCEQTVRLSQHTDCPGEQQEQER